MAYLERTIARDPTLLHEHRVKLPAIIERDPRVQSRAIAQLSQVAAQAQCMAEHSGARTARR